MPKNLHLALEWLLLAAFVVEIGAVIWLNVFGGLVNAGRPATYYALALIVSQLILVLGSPNIRRWPNVSLALMFVIFIAISIFASDALIDSTGGFLKAVIYAAPAFLIGSPMVYLALAFSGAAVVGFCVNIFPSAWSQRLQFVPLFLPILYLIFSVLVCLLLAGFAHALESGPPLI